MGEPLHLTHKKTQTERWHSEETLMPLHTQTHTHTKTHTNHVLVIGTPTNPLRSRNKNVCMPLHSGHADQACFKRFYVLERKQKKISEKNKIALKGLSFLANFTSEKDTNAAKHEANKQTNITLNNIFFWSVVLKSYKSFLVGSSL